MALDAGDKEATLGLTKAIYDAIALQFGPSLKELSDEESEPIRDGWRQLSFAVATGVVAGLVKKGSPDVPDPLFAETFSSSAEDPDFWPWFAGFVEAFNKWAPTSDDGKKLRQSLNNYVLKKNVPTSLKGVLR